MTECNPAKSNLKSLLLHGIYLYLASAPNEAAGLGLQLLGESD